MGIKQIRAYCFRSGQIGFQPMRERMPDGSLLVATGPEKIVGPLVRGLARLAYDNETYLVPGCPEAQTEDEAFKAFMTFFDRVRIALERKAA